MMYVLERLVLHHLTFSFIRVRTPSIMLIYSQLLIYSVKRIIQKQSTPHLNISLIRTGSLHANNFARVSVSFLKFPSAHVNISYILNHLNKNISLKGKRLLEG